MFCSFVYRCDERTKFICFVCLIFFPRLCLLFGSSVRSTVFFSFIAFITETKHERVVFFVWIIFNKRTNKLCKNRMELPEETALSPFHRNRLWLILVFFLLLFSFFSIFRPTIFRWFLVPFEKFSTHLTKQICNMFCRQYECALFLKLGPIILLNGTFRVDLNAKNSNNKQQTTT